AVVARFADEEQHAAMVGGLLLEQINGVADGIENGRTAVATRHLAQIAGDGVGVVTEGLDPGGFGIEGDERDIAAAIAGEEIEERTELADFVELERCVAAAFDADHERDRRRIEIVVDVEFLFNAIVENGKICGLEAVDYFAVRFFDQRRYDHDAGTDVEGGHVGVGIGGEILGRKARVLGLCGRLLIFWLDGRLARERLGLGLGLRWLRLLRWLAGKWLLRDAEGRGDAERDQQEPSGTDQRHSSHYIRGRRTRRGYGRGERVPATRAREIFAVN